MAKWTHAAGYGGYGAVMGSKNLKAVAVKGTGPLPAVANLAEVRRLIDVVNSNAYENVLWRRWGTGGGGYNFAFRTSSEPIRNWQEEWHDEKSYGVDQFESRLWVKQSWSDFGCGTNCMKIAQVKSGKFKGAITDNPDYEMEAYLGPNLGIFVPEEDVFMSSLADDLGLCGIQTGNVMGFAAELFQRGILSKDDLDGLDLKWGNTEAFAALAEKIAMREGVGDLLAEGTYRAALKIEKMKGKSVLQYAVQSKGIGIGAHGIRSGKDFSNDIGFACSVQCGDHTSMSDLSVDGIVGEVWSVFNDSAVCCNFSGGFGLPRSLKFDFYNAVTGLELTREVWGKGSGLKTLQMQRALLLLGGPDLKWNPIVHDDNPSRFYEPLPSGPYKGKAPDRNSVRKSLQQYYREIGWDENGVPEYEILKKQGLEDVGKALKKLRM
jgi:aldehyde:ferredoxin oxidoreductase